MLLELILSHEDVTALTNAIKKVNVGDAVDQVSQSWDQVVASTIKNYFQKVGLNEDATDSEQDDRPAQDQEEMFHLARVTGIELEEEIVIEDIPAFDILDDGWEEAILSVRQMEFEIEEEEPKFLLPKPTITKTSNANV